MLNFRWKAFHIFGTDQSGAGGPLRGFYGSMSLSGRTWLCEKHRQRKT